MTRFQCFKINAILKGLCDVHLAVYQLDKHRSGRSPTQKTSSKGIVKDIWDKPITKIAAFGSAMVAANKIGKALGKTSYQTGRDLSPRYKKSVRYAHRFI